MVWYISYLPIDVGATVSLMARGWDGAMAVEAEPAKPGWLVAALAEAESGPGWLQALQVLANMAKLQAQAEVIGTRRKGIHAGRPVSDGFLRRQWELYEQVRREDIEQEAARARVEPSSCCTPHKEMFRGGTSPAVFASASPWARRLFGLDE